MIELKTKCIDTATGLKGRVSHCLLLGSGATPLYYFEPKGPTKDDTIRKPMLVSPERLKTRGGGEMPMARFPEIMQTRLFGEQVKSRNSGIRGTIVALIAHPNGCVHAEVQRRVTKSGVIPPRVDFDLRDLKGDVLTEMHEAGDFDDAKPSPSPVPPVA